MNQFFSSTIHSLPVDSILVDRASRQRREFSVEDLKPSITKRGLMNPIIIKRDGTLVAGERRLTAFRELGIAEIPCRYLEEINPVEIKIIELEENFKRVDLTWQDQAGAIAQIHQLYSKLDPNWTAGETAASLGISATAVSKQIRLWNEIAEGNERVIGASGQDNAYNLLARKDQRASVRALEELIQASPARPIFASQNSSAEAPDTKAESSGEGEVQSPVLSPPLDVLHGSFLEWAPLYRGEKFNLIHCDFPYGANLFSSEYGIRGSDITYEDSKNVYYDLLDCFARNLDSFCSISAHFVFWLSLEHLETTKAIFRNQAPSIEWVRDPLIWLKSDNAGIIRDARRHPRHVYEAALFGYRGSRQIVKSVADAYAAPTDRGLHPSAKPEPMLKHFFSMLVDEHTSLFDPTCGAGSSLRAADALGASRVFGIELDPEHASIAQTTLNNSRRLRHASKSTERL